MVENTAKGIKLNQQIQEIVTNPDRSGARLTTLNPDGSKTEVNQSGLIRIAYDGGSEASVERIFKPSKIGDRILWPVMRICRVELGENCRLPVVDYYVTDDLFLPERIIRILTSPLIRRSDQPAAVANQGEMIRNEQIDDIVHITGTVGFPFNRFLAYQATFPVQKGKNWFRVKRSVVDNIDAPHRVLDDLNRLGFDFQIRQTTKDV